MFNKKQSPQNENNENLQTNSSGNKFVDSLKSAFSKTKTVCNNTYLRLRHRGHEESYYYNADGTAKSWLELWVNNV